NVQTVFAGRWGDTTTALDPAIFKGKVAVFVATPATAGLTGRGGGAGAGGDTAATTGGGRGRAPRCDSVPDKFGAAAAAKGEAAARADSVAGRTRGRPGARPGARAHEGRGGRRPARGRVCVGGRAQRSQRRQRDARAPRLAARRQPRDATAGEQ